MAVKSLTGIGAEQVESSSYLEIPNSFDQVQAIIIFNNSGIILSVNNCFAAMIGEPAANFEGRKLSELCGNFDENQNKVQEYEFGGKNGYKFWIMGGVGRRDDGTMMLCGFDITSVKQELKVKTDIMNMTSIVSEADLKGDILSINEKYIEVSKYSKEELIGRPHNVTRHGDMPKEVFKELWSTIGRGNIFRGVVKNRKKDGTPYYVDAVIAPIIGPNGKPRKYIGVRYDITDTEVERHNMRGVLNAINSSYAYI